MRYWKYAFGVFALITLGIGVANASQLRPFFTLQPSGGGNAQIKGDLSVFRSSASAQQGIDILLNANGSNNDVMDMGPGPDWIIFTGDDANIIFGSGNPANVGADTDQIEYVADPGGNDAADVLRATADTVFVQTNGGNLDLESNRNGTGSAIKLNTSTGGIELTVR